MDHHVRESSIPCWREIAHSDLTRLAPDPSLPVNAGLSYSTMHIVYHYFMLMLALRALVGPRHDAQ